MMGRAKPLDSIHKKVILIKDGMEKTKHTIGLAEEKKLK